MIESPKRKHAAMWFAIRACLCLLGASPALRADDLADFAAFQKSALADLEQAHAKILQADRNDANLEQYAQRLRLIDDVAQLLIQEFTRVKSASLDILVDDPLGKSPAKPAGRQGPARSLATRPDASQPMDALAILDRYSDELTASLSLPALGREELETLRNYYDAKAKAASRFIAQKGRPIAAVNPARSSDILELCLVIPFLHVADAAWTQEQVDLLPDWMKAGANLEKMEKFSLGSRRPLTAWQFAIRQARLKKTQPEDLLEYLRKSAQEAVANREYHCAIQCYRSAVAQAQSRQLKDVATSIQVSLCELLARLEHPQLAASEIKAAMDANPSSAEFGKAAVLRLKFLYESSQFDQILKESGDYQKDDRCGQQLPQIMYITWVSARRQNQQDKADALASNFLKQFPDHPLGADLYFASAMSKLAEGKYEEAIKLLETVEVRYPKSPLIPKVKEVHTRLQSASTTPA